MKDLFNYAALIKNGHELLRQLVAVAEVGGGEEVAHEEEVGGGDELGGGVSLEGGVSVGGS
jgi:hypothetical protein